MKKATKDENKLTESIRDLDHALEFADQAMQDRFYFAGIAKSFETCLAYAWKHFKQVSIESGLEVYSPKDAIRMAGRLGLIENVEEWLDFLKDRNLAVHDYLGMADEEYLKTIHAFSRAVKKIRS